MLHGRLEQGALLEVDVTLESVGEGEETRARTARQRGSDDLANGLMFGRYPAHQIGLTLRLERVDEAIFFATEVWLYIAGDHHEHLLQHEARCGVVLIVRALTGAASDRELVLVFGREFDQGGVSSCGHGRE